MVVPTSATGELNVRASQEDDDQLLLPICHLSKRMINSHLLARNRNVAQQLRAQLQSNIIMPTAATIHNMTGHRQQQQQQANDTVPNKQRQHSQQTDIMTTHNKNIVRRVCGETKPNIARQISLASLSPVATLVAAAATPPPPPTTTTTQPSTTTRNRKLTFAANCKLSRAILFTLATILLLINLNLISKNSMTSASLVAQLPNVDQIVRHVFPHQAGELSPSGAQFDSSPYKNIYDAIQSHPDLREFARLCEAKGVQEIVRMDTSPLTVFAPIDRSLADLVAKSKLRSINLVEFARHHVAHTLNNQPDEQGTRYPVKLNSWTMSPLYLVQATHQPDSPVYVNNAKIVSTYLIPIDDGTGQQYQTLHLIDSPLDFAYVTRRAHQLAAGIQTNGNAATRTTNVKRPLALDDLLVGTGATESSSAVIEFEDKFGDLTAGQLAVDLMHAQAFRNTNTNNNNNNQQQPDRVRLTREQLDFEQLAKYVRQQVELRGKLYQVNESTSLNTYFLPVNSDELRTLIVAATKDEQRNDLFASALTAHIIPGQVLFTRAMSLGAGYSTLFDGSTRHQQVTLSLAKTLPASLFSDHLDNLESIGKGLLSSALLLQAQCVSLTNNNNNNNSATTLGHAHAGEQQVGVAQATANKHKQKHQIGFTQSELILANIPLNNGVLHLIRRPILLTQNTNVLNYVNNNENQLNNLVGSIGTRSASQTAASSLLASLRHRNSQPAGESVTLINGNGDNDDQTSEQIDTTPITLDRFRELLAGARDLLPLFQAGQHNRTILAPSDAAFARLRYDLRALVAGDESLVPSHWDKSYRADLLERLIKRHVMPAQFISVSDQCGSGTGSNLVSTISAKGQEIRFQCPTSAEAAATFECADSPGQRAAHILHRDLVGSNGILQIIDRVLGEQQETIYSLVESNVLRHSVNTNSRLNEDGGQVNYAQAKLTAGQHELAQVVEDNLLRLHASNENDNTNQLIATTGGEQTVATSSEQQLQSVELNLIAKTIGIYLHELSSTASKRQQLQLLANSVNISFQLARVCSPTGDWNDRLDCAKCQLTYFAPSDLAWLRLQQMQPELYKPLTHFLELRHQQQPTAAAATANEDQQQQQPQPQQSHAKSPRLSESSHRLLQILERHLIADRKLSLKQLDQMDSMRAFAGVTLRLVDQQAQGVQADQQQQQQHRFVAGDPLAGALHSIMPPTGNTNNNPNQQLPAAATTWPLETSLKFATTFVSQKAIRLTSANSPVANIIQANETSNGFLYTIDQVLVLPEDVVYLQQTSSTPALASSMSSLLGGHNSVILDFIQSLLTPTTGQVSAQSMLALIGTLSVAIVLLILVALVLVIRKRNQNKLTRHQQLESGLTSSSSANSGSTSTTKSL